MDIGPIPGIYQPTQWLTISGSVNGNRVFLFESFFLPKLKAVLTEKGLKTPENLISNKCSDTLHCQTVFMKAIQFVLKMNLMYQKEELFKSRMEYSTVRPDFHLGRFLSLFADKMFNLKEVFDSSSDSNLK